MTRFLLDVAAYQGDLSPADVKRAGFDAVNLKISHGLGRGAKALPVTVDQPRRVSRAINASLVHPLISWWVSQARELDLGISTFHYFTADASGIDQANYAFDRMKLLRLETGTAHQMDVEAAVVPDFAEVRAYMARMKQLLGRPIIVYTGDWWWTARPGWNVSDLTPYLWSAPNQGYLGVYPGDTSPHWKAGYGGWTDLSVMQYAVEPLTFPDGTRGTIKVSKSAIRSEAAWSALTGKGPGDMTSAPQSLLDVRHEFQRYTNQPNVALGIVRNEPHTSYHVGKSWVKAGAYSVNESARDRNGLTEASAAIDIGEWTVTRNNKTHTLRTFSLWLVDQCKSGAADTLDIREIIYTPDGSVVKRWDRLGKRSSGDSSHLSHTHISWFRDSENHDRAAVIRRYFRDEVEGADMPTLDNVDKAWLTSQIKPLQDALGALTKANPLVGSDGKPDGTTATAIGKAAWDQGVPSPWAGGERVRAYRLMGQTAEGVQQLAAQLAAARAENAALESGTALLITRLTELVTAGGGDPDIGALMSRMDQLKADLVQAARVAGDAAADSVMETMRRAAIAEAEALRASRGESGGDST